MINRNGKDGVYVFTIETDINDITGVWRADLEVGPKVFSKEIKIETVVPYKLKVIIDKDKDHDTSINKDIAVNIKSTYLFGNPAKGHKASVNFELTSFDVGFKDYPDYVFTHPGFKFNSWKSSKIEDELNDEGEWKLCWKIPNISKVPSGLKVKVTARVLEKGGRPVEKTESFPVDFYKQYIGIKRNDREKYKLNDLVKLNVIVLDSNGKKLTNKKVKYKIYHSRQFGGGIMMINHSLKAF